MRRAWTRNRKEKNQVGISKLKRDSSFCPSLVRLHLHWLGGPPVGEFKFFQRVWAALNDPLKRLQNLPGVPLADSGGPVKVVSKNNEFPEERKNHQVRTCTYKRQWARLQNESLWASKVTIKGKGNKPRIWCWFQHLEMAERWEWCLWREPLAGSEGWRRLAGPHPQAGLLEMQAGSPRLPPPWPLPLVETQKGAPVLNILEILLRFQMKNCSAFEAKWKSGGSTCFPLSFKRECNIPTTSLSICIILFQVETRNYEGRHSIKTKGINRITASFL